MTSQLELLTTESGKRIAPDDKEAGRRGIAEARAVLARAQASGRVIDVRIIRDVA